MTTSLAWTRIRAGLYVATLPDGREAEVRSLDAPVYAGTGYSGLGWHLIVDEEWWDTKATKRECIEALLNSLEQA